MGNVKKLASQKAKRKRINYQVVPGREESHPFPIEPVVVEKNNYSEKRHGSYSSEKTYAQKLLDPRWQRMKSAIMIRDDYTCQRCFAIKDTVQVHHKYYERGREPWDYPEDALITYCVHCHKLLHEKRNIIYSMSKQLLSAGYNELDLFNLTEALKARAQNNNDVHVEIDALCGLIRNSSAMYLCVDKHLEGLM